MHQIMDEFSIIENFFKSISSNRSNLVKCTIGDDAAVVQVPISDELVISTDTMVEGVHFLSDWNADVIAYKALASNVSDIVAMAGKAKWCSLALTLPSINEKWLRDFSKGLNNALEKFDVDLIGGDLSKGPLTITITIHGLVSKGKYILRSGAKVNDLIYVSGDLGGPKYAVEQLKIKPYSDPIFNKLFYPSPKINYSSLLQNFASSAIDISDGLSSDLSHILYSSKVGAIIEQSLLPLAKHLKSIIPLDKQIDYSLNSGDEYELCFTVPSNKIIEFESTMLKSKLDFYMIGCIDNGNGLRLLNLENKITSISSNGFKHF